jgi:Transposase family tnp2
MIVKKLHLSKLTWKEKREKLWSNRRIEHSGVKHSTGKDRAYYLLRYFLCLHHDIVDRFFEPILVGVDPIHQLSIFLVIACQVILGQSRRGGSFIFSMLQYLVQLCLMRDAEKISSRDRLLLSDFPGDPRPAEKALRLDRHSIIFAICPKDSCHQSHKPTFNLGSPIPIYPKYCLGHHFGKPCKEELLRSKQIQGNVVFLPLKSFVYFDPKDWVGSQLSGAGLEAKMDAAWSQTTESKRSDTMRDIFDGEMLQNFKGPDGKHFGHEEDEGRYVFSLSIDFFNPLSNKQSGKKVSVGIISLICLNLPPDIRYKPEHMCLVGIIPGPHEPPLTTLNHYLTPLVDDFLDFWHPGVRFSRTDGYKHGRLVRCAIVCVVCDLPAARKTSGFGPSSHSHFCAICHCTRQSHGYGDINCHLWRRRTQEECLASAKTFNEAETKSEQDAAFASSGVKWSELLRLPYFDPTRFVVIDAMHNLFLGLINEHFQNILGIRLDKDKELSGSAINVHFTDPRWETKTEVEKKDCKKLLGWLRMPLNTELNTIEGQEQWLKKFSGLRLTVLQLASDELRCRALPSDERKVTMRRVDYARGLLSWVCRPLSYINITLDELSSVDLRLR